MATKTKMPDTSPGKSGSFYSVLLSKGPYLFVWGIWLAMMSIAIAFVFRYGRNIPIQEDWNMVAGITNHQGNMLTWLWEQNNEHRIPLPKFVLYLLLQATHGDFRSGMILNILSCGLVAALFIRVMYKLRQNKTAYTDAFFPIALLHIGNWENLFWSWQFTFILSTLLTCIFLIIRVQYTGLLTMKKALLVCIGMIALPLSGANGLLCLLPVMPWLAYEGFLHLRLRQEGANQKTGYLIYFSILVTIFFIFVYFHDYYKPWWNPPNPGIGPSLKTSLKFMALGFGPAVSAAWWLFSALAAGLTLMSGFLLVKVLRNTGNPEFQRAFTLFLFFGGALAYALAMGWGRAGYVPTVGMPIRYVMLALPGLIVCYFICFLYGRQWMKQLVSWGLLMIMFILIIPNTTKGFVWRNWYLEGTHAVMVDLKKGISHDEMINKYENFLCHSNRELLSDGLTYLKQHGIGPFQFLK